MYESAVARIRIIITDTCRAARISLTVASNDRDLDRELEGSGVAQHPGKVEYCGLFDNSVTQEVEYRVGQSWKAFGAHRDMLCNKKASLRRRFALLEKVVFPSISWGAGSWTMTQRHLDSVRTTQHKMMRRMHSYGS